MQKAIKAAFYRGGTSKGLFFHARDLAPYPQSVRDKIILAAMGSPDPDGRQIDGLGGGISSLSKVAVLSSPVEELSLAREYAHRLPAVNSTRDPREYDVVYRFAQVGVREPVVDWGSTCGNLVAAVAQFAVEEGLVQTQTLQTPTSYDPFPHLVRILAANSGKIVLARLQLQLSQDKSGYFVVTEGNTSIAGVPGTSSPIEIENPLDRDPLPTGRVRDFVTVDGKQIECSVVDAGLPVVFVPSTALFDSTSAFLAPPADLDASPVMHLIEKIRYEASQLSPTLQSVFSSAAPKVCIVGPTTTYTTTGGTQVKESEIDLVIRSISVGNVHRTIPATTLAALAVAAAYPQSIVAETISSLTSRTDHDSVTVRAGHPAGTAEATAKMVEQQPKSIAYIRTARRLFQGDVLVPPSIFASE